MMTSLRRLFGVASICWILPSLGQPATEPHSDQILSPTGNFWPDFREFRELRDPEGKKTVAAAQSLSYTEGGDVLGRSLGVAGQ